MICRHSHYSGCVSLNIGAKYIFIMELCISDDMLLAYNSAIPECPVIFQEYVMSQYSCLGHSYSA